MGKRVKAGAEAGARAGAKIFDKLEPEPHKIRPALQHCIDLPVHSELDHG
jgi:hypothetical protein